MHRPSVFIVDDHAAFRAVARDMLTRSGFDVVGKAGDGQAAIEATTQVHPSVVVLDVRRLALHNFEVARRLLARRGVGRAPGHP